MRTHKKKIQKITMLQMINFKLSKLLKLSFIN